MSSAFEAMQPFVEWCDTPPPTDLRQAHILRALLEPNEYDPNVGARLFPFYWGTLSLRVARAGRNSRVLLWLLPT